jgi:sec-independent protein translocase protein TatC
MAAAGTIRPIGFDDHLTLVEHLTELRTRLIVCIVAFAAAAGICLWQSHTLLDILNRPLNQPALTRGAHTGLEPGSREQALAPLLRRQASVYRSMAADAHDRALRAKLQGLASESAAVAGTVSSVAPRRPVTLGVGEPFSVTMRVAAYGALLLTLPLLLYQAYAFVVPALSPRERKLALPLMLAIPVLFVAGAGFCYALVLPAAIRFLQGFNHAAFETLLQARDYYGFAATLMGAMGLLFQIPIGIVALNRAGIVSVRQLRHWRRYALLAIAVVAMALPGQDPVTMTLMMVPMYLLYELSIVSTALLSRRR